MIREISPALRVLIVDDESLLRWAAAETLRASGCLVVEALDAEGALAALAEAEEPFDVILLDYWLPDVDDLTLLATVRAVAPESRVVMISAHATPDVVEHALRLGACRVLHKPFEMTDLVPAVLQAYLSRPS
jgi:DNA-binding NtrC family response regulator